MLYVTTTEVAKELKVCRRTVHEWVWSGKLPAVKAGNLIRIKVEDLEAFLRPITTSKQPPAAA